MIFISGYLFWRSKFQKHVWRLVCPKIAKNSISNQPLFNYLKVTTNNLRYSEKGSSAEKVSKIDFCWSCFLDFYGKIIKIDVFLMIFPTSRLFRSSCMAVHGCTRIEKIQNHQKLIYFWCFSWHRDCFELGAWLSSGTQESKKSKIAKNQLKLIQTIIEVQITRFWSVPVP